jgi:ankyrin repeat protein
VPYHLKFQDLQNWVGKVESSFRIHNTSETVYAKNITVEIESNNQVELKIGNQTGRNLAVNLASLLGSNLSRLEQQAITPPINLQVYDAHDKQSAKITLRLLDKNMQEVDRQSVMWYSTSISLEGPDFFSKDSIDLSIKVQAAKLVETNQVRVYLRNSNGVAFTLNDQQVGSNGIGLADILQGDNNLDIGKTINLAIDSNPNHAPNTDITLELRNEKNQVLVYKKISWWDTNLIKATMQDLKENNTSLGLILRLLNQGNTLQKVIDRIGPEKGQTILHEAIEYGKKYKKELFYILLSAGADVNAKNKEDDTPLHIAVKGDQVEIVKTLLNAKASTTATNKDGDKPLHIAAKNGNQKIVNLLLQKETSASVADKGYIYRTPLHWAAIGNNQEVIKALIQKGDTHLIDQQDQDGRTALHLAASKDYVKMVDILLTNGADKNIKDKHGKRPTDYTKDPIIKAKLR